MDALFSVKAAAFFGAAIAMGIGSLGPALAQGMIGAKACENIGKFPDSAGQIRNTMMIAMGFVESSALYCLIIALLLIFVV